MTDVAWKAKVVFDDEVVEETGVLSYRRYRWARVRYSLFTWAGWRLRLTAWACKYGVHLCGPWRDGRGVVPGRWRQCRNCCHYEFDREGWGLKKCPTLAP